MVVNLHGTSLLIRCCMSVPAHSTTAELHAELVCSRMKWNRQKSSQCKPPQSCNLLLVLAAQVHALASTSVTSRMHSN